MRIKQIIQALINNKLLNISVKNSIQVFIRFIIGIANIKLIAFFIGPSGMAIVGQLQNFLQLGTNIAGLGFNNGIVKFTSELAHSLKQRRLFFNTALLFVLISSLILGATTAIFAKRLSLYIFQSVQFHHTICLSGIYFITMSVTQLYFSYLNGTQTLKRFIIINIILSTSGFLIGLASIILYKLSGILTAQIFLGSIAIIFCLKGIYKISYPFVPKISFTIVKRLSKYSFMALISGLLTPLTTFIIRKIISSSVSWEAAGLWDGINKISNNYIMLITMSFGYYFLPTFAKLKTNQDIKYEVYKSFKTLIPFLIVGALGIYFSRNTIINILFTLEFKLMSSLFIWQVIGDLFKILTWVIGYLFLAKEKVILYIITQIISNSSQVYLAYLFTIQDLPINLYYAVENAIFFIIMFICLQQFFKPSPLHH